MSQDEKQEADKDRTRLDCVLQVTRKMRDQMRDPYLAYRAIHRLWAELDDALTHFDKCTQEAARGQALLYCKREEREAVIAECIKVLAENDYEAAARMLQDMQR